MNQKRETGSGIPSQQSISSQLRGDTRFRFIVTSIKQYAIITLDAKGYIQGWDGAAEELLHYKEGEIIGKHGSILFTAQDMKHGLAEREMSDARTYGFAEDERWHVRKNGSTFWGSGIMSPIVHDGKLLGYVKIFRDRTKHTAQEKRKDDFVGIAGHELRNPLSILKSNIELLLLMPEVTNNPALADIHKMMNERVDRLTHLVNDLLDLSKIASGQLNPVKRRFNLQKLIEGVVHDHQSISTSHKIVLQHSEAVEVNADKDQIIQVLNNLISNAMKYSPGEKNVEVSLYNKPEHAYVSVRDYGVGISEKEKGRIFERFYRVGNSVHAAEGLGIGLYVCLEIIKAHGGTIAVESTEGKGSTFYFTLPK
jgi:PAS domain S-box-containing protein